MLKNIVSAIIPLKAISPRNLTSLLLVGLFFAVYVIAGGKIGPAPKVKAGFGAPVVDSIKEKKTQGVSAFVGKRSDLGVKTESLRKRMLEDDKKEPETRTLPDSSVNGSANTSDSLDSSSIYKNLQNRIKRSRRP